MYRAHCRILALVALVTAILAGAAQAQAQKVGVVDLSRVLDGWTKVKEFEDGINKRIQDTQTEIENLGKEVEALTGEIQQLLEDGWQLDSEKVQSLSEERRMKVAKLKSTRDFNLQYLERMVVTQTKSFYEEIIKKIADYGGQNGFDLIFKSSSEDVEATDDTTLRLKIAAKSVIYHAPDIDLTEAILAELNK